jgi:hypothetical protein
MPFLFLSLPPLSQIDSHMRFRPNWDVYLIACLNACPAKTKPVLTAYPPGYTLSPPTQPPPPPQPKPVENAIATAMEAAEAAEAAAAAAATTGDAAADAADAAAVAEVLFERGEVSSELRPTLLCPTMFGLDDGMLRQVSS